MFHTFIIAALLGIAHAAPKEIILKNAKGEEVGKATLTEMVNGVKLDVQAHGLTPGEHALHFHDSGSCKPPKFDSAGPHFAPEKHAHGFDMKEGPHAGDMPNLIAGADGTAQVEVVNTSVSMGTGKNSLLKTGGTALVIHAKADDYKSQPAGAAGDRVACGEIK